MVAQSGGVLAVWRGFEGRVRLVLHGDRGLCVQFLLENCRFMVFELVKRCFG